MTVVTEREYRYWLSKHGDRSKNNIIYANFPVLIGSNKDDFDRNKVQYIYFTGIKDSSLNFITLFHYDEQYGLLDYTDNHATLYFDTSVDQVLRNISLEKVHQCNILYREEVCLTPDEVAALQGVVATDFISSSEKANLFRPYVAPRINIDLSGLYMLSPEDIVGTFPHEELIVYQNARFTHFDWLKSFPRATLLSIWYVDGIADTHLSRIPAQISTLELHGLPCITEMAIYGIPETIKKLIIDYNLLSLPNDNGSPTAGTLALTLTLNSTLEFLVLNNTGLTAKYLEDVKRNFTGLTHLFLPENVLYPDLARDSKVFIGKC